MITKQALLRRLPSVDNMLQVDPLPDYIASYGYDVMLRAVREVLDDVRQHILAGQLDDFSVAELVEQVVQWVEQMFMPTLRPVINATGVIVHTNLGRALLSESAQQAMVAVAGSYNTLEFDLENGKRGSRLVHATQLLQDLTGADAALVVNNNASALIMILSALARDHEVVISRGQLVEIGGGFRIPAIMKQSGAHLVEVGTTNRTRIDDFTDAVTEQTAMFLRVHSSNFKQIGFTEQPTLAQISAVAQSRGVLAVDDLGSGTLLDTTRFGLAYEPTILDSVNAGFDVVCFSGDKLLGGPQAGIIIGKQAVMDKLKRHPLARALRVDKLTYAALTATLEHYRRGDAVEKIPVWQMISQNLNAIHQRAKHWAQQVGGTVIQGESTVGGGSLPGTTLPTALLALDVSSPDDFMATLRSSDVPVIARVSAGRVLFDPRTVLDSQEVMLLDILRRHYG